MIGRVRVGSTWGPVRRTHIFFNEAAFAAADAVLTAERAHLTTVAAGLIAREAGVRWVEPFHFSSRYAGEKERGDPLQIRCKSLNQKTGGGSRLDADGAVENHQFWF